MGALLRGVKREQLRRGMVIVAPGSMKTVGKFQAQIYVNNPERKSPLSSADVCTPRFSQRRRAVDTLLSWTIIALSSSCAQLISPLAFTGQRVPLTLLRRWSCRATTSRWFATSSTRPLPRLGRDSPFVRVVRPVSTFVPSSQPTILTDALSWNWYRHKTPLDGLNPLCSTGPPLCWIQLAIRRRALYKSCCFIAANAFLSPVPRYSPLVKSRNITSDTCVYATPNPNYLHLFTIQSLVIPGPPIRFSSEWRKSNLTDIPSSPVV